MQPSMIRREYLKGSVALLACGAAVPTSAEEKQIMNAVSNRAHLLIHPTLKEKSVWCFSTVLGCGNPMSLAAPGKADPILAFRFPDGGSISIEYTDDALDESHVRRGAWLELKSDNPAELKRKIVEAGLPQLEYWATKTFYFAVPGGQVFGIFQSDELR